MLFHDFSGEAQGASLLRSRFLSRERGGGVTQDGCTYARVVAKRAVCGRSQIATTVNCNFLARALSEGVARAQLDDRLSRAFLARRVGCFSPDGSPGVETDVNKNWSFSIFEIF